MIWRHYTIRKILPKQQSLANKNIFQNEPMELQLHMCYCYTESSFSDKTPSYLYPTHPLPTLCIPSGRKIFEEVMIDEYIGLQVFILPQTTDFSTQIEGFLNAFQVTGWSWPVLVHLCLNIFMDACSSLPFSSFEGFYISLFPYFSIILLQPRISLLLMDGLTCHQYQNYCYIIVIFFTLM